MVSRRGLIFTATAALLAAASLRRASAAPPAPNDPAGIVTAIYIAVTITGRNTPPRKPADRTVRYDFVREAGAWKIDDIKSASDGEPWSISDMLAASPKN